MPKSFFVPVVHYRRLPPLFCLSMGALIATLLTVFVLSERHGHKSAQLFQEFGSALANLTAQESLNAAAGRDRIRLQALLQGVVAQPRVVMAAAFDADRNLLAQAGQAPEDETGAVFGAVITAHNSVVGHVNLVIDTSFTGDRSLRSTLLAIIALLLITSALALYECYGDVWYLQARPLPVRKKPEPAVEPEAPEDSAPDPSATGTSGTTDSEPVVESAEPPEYSDLIVYLSNRKRLREQLNSDTFTGAIRRFERVLNRVLALYGGVRVANKSSEDYYCVRFMSHEGVTDAAFRAVCAASLLRSISQQQKVRFDTLAQICTHDCDAKIALNDSGIYLQGSVLGDGLREQLTLTEKGEGSAKVEGFDAATTALLARQQAQLSQALA